MKCNWTTKKLSEIAYINPRESLGKGVVAKKVPMDKLQPFCRDIPEFVLEEYKGGTKFRNGDTIMARITPCLENGKIAKVSVLSDGEVGFGSTEYIVFRAIDGVSDADFLYYLICSPLVRNPAIKSMVGSSGRQRVQTDVEAKYNVILQGAPGVGKTFAAKRLAYSIMGQKDTSRVAMVQFHQSYSYEDFIQGYRPSKDGFELVNGAFYKFCKEAEEDNERPYFFIIDEINRGNLSKILGELMMLIEKDKRGEKIKLLYSNEWFTVPQNVRIIGMMNTADRSLALMDYALRRRFAFFDFAPAFSSEGFKNYLSEKDSPKLEKLIAAVESLNSTISTDESLGDGFRIGHSYFCTDDEITDEWLKSVVEYEVIPLIKEYWFDEPTKVRDWSATLRSAIK